MHACTSNFNNDNLESLNWSVQMYTVFASPVPIAWVFYRIHGCLVCPDWRLLPTQLGSRRVWSATNSIMRLDCAYISYLKSCWGASARCGEERVTLGLFDFRITMSFTRPNVPLTNDISPCQAIGWLVQRELKRRFWTAFDRVSLLSALRFLHALRICRIRATFA